MGRLFVLIVLDLAANPTEGEPFSWHLKACNGNLFPFLGLFPKIDFTKIHLAQKIKAKGKIRIHLKSFHDLIVIKGHQHLFVVKCRIPIIRIVTDPAFSVRCGCKNLAHSEHQPFLTRICPHGASTSGADFFFVCCTQHLFIGTFIAKPPGFNLRNSHVHLVDFNFAPFGIEGVSRGKFLNGTPGRPLVFKAPTVITAFTVLDLGFFPVDQRVQHDPNLWKRIIGEQSFIGEKIKGIPLTDTFYQCLQG